MLTKGQYQNMACLKFHDLFETKESALATNYFVAYFVASQWHELIFDDQNYCNTISKVTNNIRNDMNAENCVVL